MKRIWRYPTEGGIDPCSVRAFALQHDLKTSFGAIPRNCAFASIKHRIIFGDGGWVVSQ